MRSRLFWLLVSGGFLAAFLVNNALPGRALRWVPPLAVPQDSPVAVGLDLLVGALVPLALVALLVLLNLDSSPPRPPGDDIDRLLGWKQRWIPRPRRLCESASRPSGPAPAAGPPEEPAFAPADVLGHLLQLKRRGAWGPHPPP
jgi:hypothetical protein